MVTASSQRGLPARWRAAGILAAVAVSSATGWAGGGLFAPGGSWDLAGDSPADALVGSFDADSFPDAAFLMSGASGGDAELVLVRGNASGTLDRQTGLAVANAYALASADLDGDGDLDLVALGRLGPLRLDTYLGDGLGGIAYGPVTVAALSSPFPGGIAAGDFDEDGLIDLAWSGTGPDVVAIQPGNGDATFAAGALYSGIASASDLLTTDFDGDGHLDLATPGTVLLGAGNGTFSKVGFLGGGTDLDAADLDRDGHTDIVTVGAGLLSVELGLGDGSFQSLPAVALGTDLRDVRLGDVNGDGLVDAVVADAGSSEVHVLPGLGDGSFATPFSYTAAGPASVVAVADWNADGLTDLAPAWGSLAARVELLQQTPSASPWFYCTAKLSSAGCTATLTTSAPLCQPASGANDYSVITAGVQAGKNGLLFYGLTGPAAVPFSGGTLCVQPPLGRTPVQPSGGSVPGACDGSLVQVVNDGTSPYDPGPGSSVWVQAWYRDPANGSGSFGTALSDAVQLTY